MVQNATFSFEQSYWDEGILAVCGIDEVGMGALAGPVVAGAVIFAAGTDISGLRDSKKLSARQREKLVNTICEQATAYAIGEASVAEIFRLNIRRASHLAMRRAVEGLATRPELLLIDGNPVQIHKAIPAVNIIKGDSLCNSIAAASIIAKVHRDRIMTALHEEFPLYDLAGNKGYGSASHMAALRAYGATIHHRAAYGPVAAVLPSLR
jgi:ribonuclease HII